MEDAMRDMPKREDEAASKAEKHLEAQGSASKLKGVGSSGTKAKTSEKSKKPKKGSAGAKRKREQRFHTITRFVVQIVFFVLAPGFFSSALNGAKYLCTQVGALEVIEPTSFVVALVAAVAYTVVFGRFFCGYACAFGAMGDVLFALAAPVRRALHIPALQNVPRLSNCLQFLKLCVLAAVCALCFFGVWDVVSDYDPWAVFGKVTSGAGLDGVATIGVAALIIIMVLQALFERSFCRFLCPMGALFNLLPILPFSSFNRYRPACAKKCNRCQDACPVDIHPDQGGFHAGECISCGRCAIGCPLQNVNLVYILEPADESPQEPKAPARPVSSGTAQGKVTVKGQCKGKRVDVLIKVKGSGIGWVVAKALVLLALCWLVGVTRFVPSPTDVLPFGLPWL